jgi:hypothetical protein
MGQTPNYGTRSPAAGGQAQGKRLLDQSVVFRSAKKNVLSQSERRTCASY